MNFAAIQPRVQMTTSRPQRVGSMGGSVFKMQINHPDEAGQNTKKYEVWTTKEAVEKHFAETGEARPQDIKSYHYQKYARHMYENRLRSTAGKPEEKGVFISSTQQVHGDPKLWPHTIVDPDIKY